MMNNSENIKIYPFKFLDSYTKEDKDIFFGRDEETNLLYEILQQSDMLLVYGASGTGKTSLIQCGLSKKYSDYDWMPFLIRKGSNLNNSILSSLQKFVPDIKDSVSDFIDQLYEEKPADKTLKNPIVAAVRNIYMNHFKPVYLIFDQFEELYILGTKEEQKEFIKTVKLLLQLEEPVKLIFLIREEYLGHLYEFEKEVPQLFRKKIRVEAMHRDKVEQIISGITLYEKSNISIDKEEVEGFTSILFEKIKGKKELTIQLTYLQVFLDKLYLNITGDQNRQQNAKFTTHALDNLGDIGNVLGEFLDEQVQEISRKLKMEFPGIDSVKLWEILSPFATLDGTKEPISVKQLYTLLQGNEQLIDNVVAEFSNRRILRYIETDDLYELVHDSLAKQVAERRSEDEIALLQARQLLKSQSSLKEEARELFSEKQLALITPFAGKLKLTASEQKLINESQKTAELKRSEKIRRQRTIIVIVSIAAIVSIAFGIFGFWQKGVAEKALNDLKLKQYEKIISDVEKLESQMKYDDAIDLLKTSFELKEDSINFINRIAALQRQKLENEELLATIAKIDALYKKQNYKEAIVLCNQALQKEPDNKTLLLRKQEIRTEIEKLIAELLSKNEYAKSAGFMNDAQKHLEEANKLRQLIK